MAFHLMAFNRAPNPSNLEGVMEAAFDQVIGFSERGYPIFPAPMSILAGYAVGPALQSVQVDTPSIREGATPYITPLDATGWQERHTTPNLMVLHPRPWLVAKEEEIFLTATDAYQTTAGDNYSVALLWLADQCVPVPRGDNYWIRYSAESAIAPDQAFSGGWHPLQVTYESRDLARGEYAVIGFEHRAEHVVAARLIFDGQVLRPGTLAIPPSAVGIRGSRTSAAFYDGSFGVYGTFKSYALPRVEYYMFENQDSDETVLHEGRLRVVRIS